jgi:hypothetical protein
MTTGAVVATIAAAKAARRQRILEVSSIWREFVAGRELRFEPYR